MISGKATLIILAVIAGWAYFDSSGINTRSLFILSFMSVLLGVSYYFGSRKAQEPTKIEKIAAIFWLVFRRFVCFVGAILFFGASMKLMFFSEVLFYKFWLSLVSICLAAFCIWVGVYGQGWQRGAWKDDVELHARNKARYKWPW